MVIGDLGVLGAHAVDIQAESIEQDLVIIQLPKMEDPSAQGHHQCMKIVSLSKKATHFFLLRFMRLST